MTGQVHGIKGRACLGCCSLAPALMINSATYGNLSPSGVVKILKRYQKGELS